MNNLKAEMQRNGLTVRDIMLTIGCSEKTARNKINGETDFTYPEAEKVRNNLFSGIEDGISVPSHRAGEERMKKLIVIYETSKLHGRKRTIAQACYKIELDDQKARLLLSGKPEANIVRQAVEKLLETVELLRGRHYVRGSIKRFSSVFEENTESREDDL